MMFLANNLSSTWSKQCLLCFFFFFLNQVLAVLFQNNVLLLLVLRVSSDCCPFSINDLMCFRVQTETTT
ncbi:unnamed protein product [Rhodiola kirilowii]